MGQLGRMKGWEGGRGGEWVRGRGGEWVGGRGGEEGEGSGWEEGEEIASCGWGGDCTTDKKQVCLWLRGLGGGGWLRGLGGVDG